MSSKRVCVIGAGMSGLASVKSCLEENLNVVCYEKTGHIGGIWKYKEDVIDGIGSVMKSTVTNTSKEFTCFSDFPFPENTPNYMHHPLFLQYMENYAKHFNLLSHIQLGTEVIDVKKADNYITNGKWKIKIKTKDKNFNEETFDFVIVCVGHHVYPNMPQYSGLNEFEGKVVHGNVYRDGKQYQNQRVVVVGIGNSGADIAVELCSMAKKIYLSTRRGTWVIERRMLGGLPIDVFFTTRFTDCVFHYMGDRIKNTVAEFMANLKFNHELYGIKPNHRFFQQHVTCNDELATKILTGFVTIKGDILKFTKTGVIYTDDYAKVVDIDAVIFATGYETKFPFLEQNLINNIKNDVSLYKFVFPPHLKHPSLAVVGLIQPLGGGIPVVELQSRWIVRVFKGLYTLPSEMNMKADIYKTRIDIQKHYVQSDRHAFEVNFIRYLDEIASFAGVKPKFLNMLLTDPKLFFYCFFGPMLPYTYRLTGPHQWRGARQAILTANERILKPLKAKNSATSEKSLIQKCSFWIIFVALVFLCGRMLFYIF